MTIEQAAKALKGDASIITVSNLISKETGESVDLIKPKVKDWLFNQYPNASTLLGLK